MTLCRHECVIPKLSSLASPLEPLGWIPCVPILLTHFAEAHDTYQAFVVWKMFLLHTHSWPVVWLLCWVSSDRLSRITLHPSPARSLPPGGWALGTTSTGSLASWFLLEVSQSLGGWRGKTGTYSVYHSVRGSAGYGPPLKAIHPLETVFPFWATQAPLKAIRVLLVRSNNKARKTKFLHGL